MIQSWPLAMGKERGYCSMDNIFKRSSFLTFHNRLLWKFHLWGLMWRNSRESLSALWKPTRLVKTEGESSHQTWMWQPCTGLYFPFPESTETFCLLFPGTAPCSPSSSTMHVPEIRHQHPNTPAPRLLLLVHRRLPAAAVATSNYRTGSCKVTREDFICMY